MSRVLYTNHTATATNEGVLAPTADDAAAEDIYSITLSPSRDYPNVRVTVLLEVYQSATALSQAVTFKIRAGGKANSVTADASFEHTTRNGIIDRQLNHYSATLPNINGGGTLKVQVMATADDAETDITGKGLFVEAVN